jgi:hypothetical protein
MGVKIYNLLVKAPTELSKSYRDNSGADKAAERKIAKEQEDLYKDDDELEAEEKKDDDEKDEAYGKSVRVFSPSEMLNKALEAEIDIDDFGVMLVLSKSAKKPIGTVSGKYKKVAEGKWVPVGRGENKHAKTEDTPAPDTKYDKMSEEEIDAEKEAGSTDSKLKSIENEINEIGAKFHNIRNGTRTLASYGFVKYTKKQALDHLNNEFKKKRAEYLSIEAESDKKPVGTKSHSRVKGSDDNWKKV